ncbi:MAG TPA: hypothetical protein VF131_16675 [Blastocatellia bacterium]|nr:hypothetical protein [Blastocatellia bacterium]
MRNRFLKRGLIVFFAIALSLSLYPLDNTVAYDDKRIKEARKALPEGSRVYIYEPGNRPALIDADLDSNGVKDVVVIHTSRPPTDGDPFPALTLSVLVRENDALSQRASVRLKTGVLSVMMFDGDVTKLALCDLTGDERLEILVLTSEMGEPGLTLRCFNFDGQSLNEIAAVSGQIFRIRSGERDRQAVITNITVDVREMKAYETRYRWNGERFEQTEKVPAEGIIVQPPKRTP